MKNDIKDKTKKDLTLKNIEAKNKSITSQKIENANKSYKKVVERNIQQKKVNNAQNQSNYLKTNKIEFRENLVFPVNITEDLTIRVWEGQPIRKDEIIANLEPKIVYETVSIIGEPTVNVGDEIKKGDVLAVKKGLIKKKTLSEYDGKIEQIKNDSIKIQLKNSENQDQKDQQFKSTTSPVTGTISKILKNTVVINFSATQLNLHLCKGQSTLGRIKYLSAKDFEDKNFGITLKGKIVFTDHLTSSMYPELTALDVKGVVANSIDYNIYEEIIILTMPIGIYSGFGNIPFDATIKKYLIESVDKDVWFDTEYSRVVINEAKKPYWIDNYRFDLNDLFQIN